MADYRMIFLKALKEIMLLSPFGKFFFYRYQFNFSPAELCFLCKCIDDTKRVPGAIVEIGCAQGNTTVFLNRHMDFCKIEKEYLAIDTFSGFTRGDVAYEVEQRAKKRKDISGFEMNKKKWFDLTMRRNNISRVKSVQAAVNNFGFDTLGEISFCLIDVDLYLPVKSALNGVYKAMNKGGIIVVDDCTPNTRWDGALEAYEEFTSSHSLKQNIILNGLGIISK